MRFKPPSRAVFLALILLLSVATIGSSWVVKPAHAAGPTYAGSGTGTTTISVTGVLPGDIVFVWMVAASVSGWNGWHITTSLGSSISNMFFGCNQAGPLNGGFNCAVEIVEGGTGTDTVSIGCTPGGCGWTGTSYFDHWQNVGSTSSLLYQKNCNNGSACPNNSGTDSQGLSPISNSANSIEQIEQITCNSTCTCPNPVLTAANSQTVETGQACAGTSSTVGSWRAVVPTGVNTNYGFTYTGAGTAPTGDNAILILYGGGTGNLGGLSQCYGNCGNPAVTLANTNSTHTVPFNQTITLLYPFQSALNGYAQNITTNLAKPYNFQTVSIGLWETTGCPINSQPFTSACPGLRVASLTSALNPSKGVFSLAFAPGQIATAAGQWFAVGVSGLFTGLDLNDTNTGVPVSQTSGSIPSQLTAISTYNSNFKMGLWAFIIGNTVVSPPPTPGPLSCATLDCILPALVNGFCQNLTAACQGGSAFLWIVILTIITIGSFLYIMQAIMPGVNPGKIGLEFIGLVVFIGWLATFGSLGLLPSFFMVLLFLVISWLFLGRLKGSGPI
jgi:hypothetical protein